MSALMCFRRSLVVALIGVAIVAPPGRPADKGDETPWEVVLVGSGRIAVPRGWRKFDKIKPNMPLYRQGDGLGVLARDETNASLQIGLTVEKFPNTKESVKDIMSELVRFIHLRRGAQRKSQRFENCAQSAS
jgi:hypothetical protein